MTEVETIRAGFLGQPIHSGLLSNGIFVVSLDRDRSFFRKKLDGILGVFGLNRGTTGFPGVAIGASGDKDSISLRLEVMFVPGSSTSILKGVLWSTLTL